MDDRNNICDKYLNRQKVGSFRKKLYDKRDKWWNDISKEKTLTFTSS